jgi:DNA-binding response OmpR family regulator
MNDARILIVDDEEGIRLTLTQILALDGYAVETAADGQEALERLAVATYDLVLLDLWMTPVDGLEVLQTLRAQDPTAAVIILTGQGTLDSALGALRLGAFDYLLKPVSLPAVRQRVSEALQHRRVLRQQQHLSDQIATLRETLQTLEVEAPPSPANRLLRSGPLTIDRHHRRATIGRRPLDVTSTEFDLLVCLVEASPKPLAPRLLVQTVLACDSSEAEASEMIKTHIYHLRRKIEPEAARPRLIKTVRYKGYVWCPEEAEALSS